MKNFGVTLDTGSAIIQPTVCERLLGATISNNFTWNSHICNNEKSMVKSLSIRINGLKKICQRTDFKTRKMFANGLINSRLIYVIQLYGTATDYLLNTLQVQQNQAARLVTKLDWRTETFELLRQVGWMSVHQLFTYHTILMVFKVVHMGKPAYFRRMFVTNSSYHTRQSSSNCLTRSETPRTELFSRSFRHNGVRLWNSLPTEMRKMSKLNDFKLKLKKWIVDHVNIR